ncbi:hypothetical protein AVEN_19892-1 [Araneus ventricosus]|uniref:THAP-type domain-containing protein n=1 Tax=Araneus ventricosus TaxID=182803 RepID=A0A4Y2JAM9_ARAVE|nr:hypothetical protein AVEN_19892-1 [Araneus ventricosus]
MPSPCCVPGCRSNYKKNENVSVFSFPRNENLKKSWITAIKRQDFIPTKHSRVCINHFPIKDVITSLKAFNERTGELIQAPLEHKR